MHVCTNGRVFVIVLLYISVVLVLYILKYCRHQCKSYLLYLLTYLLAHLITWRVPFRRMLSIRGLEARGVIHGRLAPLPGLLDRGQHGATVQAAAVERHVGGGVPLVAALVVVQGAGVGRVEVHVLEGDVAGPGAHGIARLVGDELEDVGADVEAAEGVQVPVGLGGGDLAVVAVVAVVGGADEVSRDSVTEEDGEDPVLDRVGLVLVEGD